MPGKCIPQKNLVIKTFSLELKIHYGLGYRVYFGIHEDKIIILLNGGTKSGQQTDIDQAKIYWENYHIAKKNEQGVEND